MSDFIAGFVPILVTWLVPTAMLYAAVVATVETVTKPVQAHRVRLRLAAVGRVLPRA